MNIDQFTRETTYQATMAIARSLLANSAITDIEFEYFKSQMLNKYQPLIGSLH